MGVNKQLDEFKKELINTGRLPEKIGQKMDIYHRYIPLASENEGRAKFDKYGNYINPLHSYDNE